MQVNGEILADVASPSCCSQNLAQCEEQDPPHFVILERRPYLHMNAEDVITNVTSEPIHLILFALFVY